MNKVIKIIIGMFFATLFVAESANANLILNGSFENTTSTGCDSNNSNTSFNGKMSNATAWGTANEIDIYTSVACFGSNPAIDGSVKLHLNKQTGGAFDAFNFDLASALVNGTSYDLSFYLATVSTFGAPLGSIDIGTSIDATSFGTNVFTASSTLLDTWQFFSTSFVAGANANFLSVVSTAGWMAVDGFSLTASSRGGVPEPGTLALLGLGIIGLGYTRRKKA